MIEWVCVRVFSVYSVYTIIISLNIVHFANFVVVMCSIRCWKHFHNWCNLLFSSSLLKKTLEVLKNSITQDGLSVGKRTSSITANEIVSSLYTSRSRYLCKKNHIFSSCYPWQSLKTTTTTSSTKNYNERFPKETKWNDEIMKFIHFCFRLALFEAVSTCAHATKLCAFSF